MTLPGGWKNRGAAQFSRRVDSLFLWARPGGVFPVAPLWWGGLGGVGWVGGGGAGGVGMGWPRLSKSLVLERCVKSDDLTRQHKHRHRYFDIALTVF